MTQGTREQPDAAWRRFVVEHGHGASAHDLAFILKRSIEDISQLRATGACSKGASRKNFVALFQLWNGREPGDGDWPPPQKVRCGEYEWQAPELALLASLVGRLGKAEIAQTLTARLQLLTNDPEARRGGGAVQNTISRIGMQAADVVGGITTAAAGQEIGSLAIVNRAIHKGHLRPARVGPRWVIPYDAWTAWKARRVFPPNGYVPLATLKQPLSIRSDKLSEFARMGTFRPPYAAIPMGPACHRPNSAPGMSRQTSPKGLSPTGTPGALCRGTASPSATICAPRIGYGGRASTQRAARPARRFGGKEARPRYSRITQSATLRSPTERSGT